MNILPFVLTSILAALFRADASKTIIGRTLLQSKSSTTAQASPHGVTQAAFLTALASYLERDPSSKSPIQLFQNSLSSSEIPCHIHQQWKTHQLNSMQQRSADSWKKKNPECKYTLWSDHEIEAFMQTNFKDSIWPIWKYLQPIQRADAFRYAVLLRKGGYYADIDVDCVRSIKEWKVPEDVRLILGYETNEHLSENTRKNVVFSRSEQMNNFFLASAPGHEVLQRCLEILKMKFAWGIEDTLELTGPATLSDAAHEFLHKASGDSGAEPSYLQRPLGEGGKGLHYATEQAVGPSGEKVWIFTADQVAGPIGFSTHAGSNLIFHHYSGSWKTES